MKLQYKLQASQTIHPRDLIRTCAALQRKEPGNLEFDYEGEHWHNCIKDEIAVFMMSVHYSMYLPVYSKVGDYYRIIRVTKESVSESLCAN